MSAKWLPLLLCLALLPTPGCGGSACESYLEALREKAQACDAPMPPAEDEATCTEEGAKTAERLEACVRESSCEAFRESTFAKKCLDGAG